MNNKILLGLVIAIILLLSAVTVSAISISYSDSYLPDKITSKSQTSGDIKSIKSLLTDKEIKDKKDLIKSRYPKVEITTNKFLGLFGGDPIMDLEIIDNTEYCTIDCYSVLSVDIHKKTKLLDQIETRSFVGTKLEYTNNIATKIYILQNVSYTITQPKLVEQCKNIDILIGKSSNTGTTETKPGIIKECTLEANGQTETITEWKEEFVEYNGEELDTGNYIVKITGTKNFNEAIDWVPKIQNERIEALAWWNTTNLYGDGSMGDVVFTVALGTRNFSNMTLNVDYTVGGNTLYLMTDKVYNFNSFYLGPGTTLSTNNVTGAVIYLLSKTNMNIQGIIDLSARLQPGQYNSTSFSYLGDSFTTPSTASGGSSYTGATQGGGFGGAGRSGNGYIDGCSVPTAGTGGNGGYPFGPAGGGSSVTSTNDNCVQSTVGGVGARSGGGGGPSSAWDGPSSNCVISASGGAGGGSYGAGGGGGGSTGTHGSTWDCFSGSVGNGGGGAGGSAGRPGLNLVIRAKNMTLPSAVNSIVIKGTSGTNGGSGGSSIYGTWPGGSGGWTTRATGCGGFGGGGGGGANAGSLRIYYRYLTNTTAINTIVNQTGGSGGSGGTNSPYAPDCSTYTSNSGGVGSAGSTTLFREGFVETTLINPTNGSQVVIPPTMIFTANVTPYSVTLVNATFYLWNGTTLYTNTTILSGSAPVNLNWTKDSSYFEDGIYSWAVQTCFTDGTAAKFCDQTQNNTFTTFSVQFDGTTYNNATYEMLNETYTMNVTSTGFVNLSGTLVWDGIEYPASTIGNNVNATFIRSIWIPTGAGNKTFHWHVFYGGQLKESTSFNVTILNSQFNICNFSSTLNTTYLTINYKDETTNLPINATILSSSWNYNITNSPYGETLNYNSPLINGTQLTALQHQFCFIPKYAPITVSSTYQFGNPELGYVTKTWIFNSLQLTNSSATTYTLYLINLVDSGTTPVTFQTVSGQTNAIIPNVKIDIYRDISGVSTLVNTGYTDNAGTISFYLSPITPYTIIASGGGCSALTSTITPTASQYNLLLDCQALSAQEFTSFLDGITYTRTPADGVSKPNAATLYTFGIQSVILNMTRVRFEIVDARTGALLNSNDSLTNTADCTSSDCFLSFTYPTYTGDNIKGRYYVAVNGTNDSSLVLIEGDAYWRFIVINQNNSVNAVGRFMEHLQEMFSTWGANNNNVNCIKYTDDLTCGAIPECKWVNETVWASRDSEIYGEPTGTCVFRDDLNKAEFNRIVFIFFFMVVFLFILGRTVGYEANHPGAFIIIMSVVIWILSLYGMFTFQGLTQFAFFNQYIFALTTTFVGVGYAVSVVRRYSG